MAIQTFDDFSGDDLYTAEITPFEFRENPNDKKATLNWLNENFSREYEKADLRFQTYRRHLNLYKNLRDDGDSMVRTSNRDRGIPQKKPVIKVNKAYEYTESRVAQVSRQKVNVALIPRNMSEQQDINNAKACKTFLDARSEEIDLDRLHRDQDRVTFLYGTSFHGVYWDPDSGPTSPAWEEAVKKYGQGKVPMLDENKKPIEGKYLSEAPHIGDVCNKVYSPLDVMVDPSANEWSEANWVETIDWKHKEWVKAKYPREYKDIDGVNNRVQYDLQQNLVHVPENMIMVRTFWHKPTEFLPKGAKIIYCDEVILERGDFPYADGKLPLVPDVDVEVPGEVWGRSFLMNIEQLIRMNNNMVSGAARAHGVGSAPKWMVPEGSVDQKSINNEYGAVVYRGPVAPKLEFPQWVNRGELEYGQALDTQMGRLSGIFDISKGNVPAGITAASAIRYLDEQEQQRASNTISKRKRRVLDVYRLMISRMAQYYSESDGRSVKLLGKNNEYLIKSFKNMDFNQIYDVRLENTPMLADTKSGRIADIIDLNAANQQDPLFGKEEMVELLDLGLNDAFKTESTYGVDAARTILEMILNGDKVPDPEESDNLIAMLRIFYRHIESVTFKLYTDTQIKQVLKDYVAATEMLASEKMQKNQKFAMELAMLSKFPVYFDVSDIQSEIAPSPLPQANPAAGLQAQGLDTSNMELKQEQIQKEMQQGE